VRESCVCGALRSRRSAAEAQLREKSSELAATQAQFVQLLSDFKFNLKARGPGA